MIADYTPLYLLYSYQSQVSQADWLKAGQEGSFSFLKRGAGGIHTGKVCSSFS